MNSILIVGGGGHCRSLIDVIETQGVYRIVGILDNEKKMGDTILNYPIIGSDADLSSVTSLVKNVVIAVGQIKSPQIRKRLYESTKACEIELPVISSPYAYISKHSMILESVSVMHGAIINAGVKIGVNCIINSMALIEHDVCVGDHCHIASGARINGGVTIESGSFIGSGAVLKQGVTVGQNCVIGAGCIVLDDVANNIVMRAST
jgi:sugar O-acyltransferase (sialic acid O-acetyltransferase NeuD family)